MKYATSRKGQVEFVVIAAIILIALVVVILALQQTAVTRPEETGVSEEAKTVKDSVNNLIKTGFKEQMKLIYNQGGTLTPQTGLNVEFGMFKTAVWQACDQTNVPNVAKGMEAGIGAYLRNNLENEEEFAGKEVIFDFSKIEVDVDVFKDNMRVRVNLPSTIVGYSIPQPYEVSLPTKLYDILELSGNLVNDVSEIRFFENLTLVSMLHSNPEHENWVPVAGTQAGCGNVLFKSRRDILPGIKGIVKYIVDHVVWGTQPLRIAENPFYPVYGVGGKLYPDMEVDFAYPPSWDSKMDGYFMFDPEPLMVIPKPIMPMVPLCKGTYAVSYTFRYPVIVMVKDSILNQWFKFAVMVDIQNTLPGNCTVEFGRESEYAEVCSQANCDAKITVKDSTDSPIEGADANFYLCDIGLTGTDANGMLKGKIPCMVSELRVYKQGYMTYGDLLSSEDVENMEVTLKKIADNVTIHLKGLEMELNSTSNDYKIDPDGEGVMSLTESNFGKELLVFITFSPTHTNIFTGENKPLGPLHNYDHHGNLIPHITTYGLLPTEYKVTVSVADNENGRPLGYIDTSFELGEHENEIYVYLPVVLKVDGDDWEEDDPGIKPEEVEKLTNKMIEYCNEPLIRTEHTCT